MAPHVSSRITSVGFIGSGRLAECVARELIKKITPQRKFCYQKQRLVSTLLASDPSRERRQVFDRLGFTTTDQNDEILHDCDVVFIGTNAREALTQEFARKPRARLLGEQLRNRLFVALMGDMPAEQVESLIYPGAKVIRMMPQTYLEQKGLAQGLLPPSGWATARNKHASAEDVKRVVDLAGIATCLEINEGHADVWAFNSGAAASVGIAPTLSSAEQRVLDDELVDGDNRLDTSLDDDGPDFHDQYVLGKYLGTGRFANVYKATHREMGQEFAVKCVTEEELTREAHETLIAEVAALSRLNHPNVITHHGFYSENDKYYLLLDYCEHGSVSRLLRGGQRVAEPVAKSIIRQLLLALEYCHAMGLVHRDIKAENVLLTTANHDHSDHDAQHYQVKLADFGLSKELDLVSGYLQDVCGTPQYLSPEIVSGRTYAQPADIWSAGILSYMLLSGHVPFAHAASEAELFRDIRTGAIWYNLPGWQDVSREAKDFVQSMLEISPASRPTATKLLHHKWFQASS